jgi:hypothetical protein
LEREGLDGVAGSYILQPRWSSEKKHALNAGVPSSIVYLYFRGTNKSSEAARGGGARSVPFAVLISPKDGCAQRMGAGQNTLVGNIRIVLQAHSLTFFVENPPLPVPISLPPPRPFPLPLYPVLLKSL